MKTWLLVVTWIVSDQPPSIYQVRFNSAEACEVARNAVLAEGRRIKAESVDHSRLWDSPLDAPKVTAVCAAQ